MHFHKYFKSDRNTWKPPGLKSEANVENAPTSHLIVYISKHFSDEFMVLVVSFTLLSIQQDVYFELK